MLYLGLRLGEAAGLSWNDIDFVNGTIHIWRARTTNTDGSVTIGNTKTPGSIRTLEAPQVVLDASNATTNDKTTTPTPSARRGPTPTTWCSPHPADDPPTPKRSATNSTTSSPPPASRATGPPTCCVTLPPA